MGEAPSQVVPMRGSLYPPPHPPACLEELLEAKTSESAWIEGWQGRVRELWGTGWRETGKFPAGVT